MVDPAIVRRAKSYASARHTSVSSLVEAYLKNLTLEHDDRPSLDPVSWLPTTKALFGWLSPDEDERLDVDELKRRHLTGKYLQD